MDKLIIGLTGESGTGKTAVADMLSEKGFCKVSIRAKVKDMASRFFSKEDFEKDEDRIMLEMRNRGFKTTPSYWINLALVSLPDKHDLIVLDDVSEQEASNVGVVSMYQVCREGVSSSKIQNVEIISNDGDLDDLRSNIDALCKTLT